MLVGAKLKLPLKVTRLSENRLIEVLKISAAEHFRLSSLINPTTLTANLAATTANDLNLNVKFTEYSNPDTYKEVIENAVNMRFDLKTCRTPLWRADIVGPAGLNSCSN